MILRFCYKKKISHIFQGDLPSVKGRQRNWRHTLESERRGEEGGILILIQQNVQAREEGTGRGGRKRFSQSHWQFTAKHVPVEKIKL